MSRSVWTQKTMKASSLIRNYRNWFFIKGHSIIPALMRIIFGILYLWILWDFDPIRKLLFENGTLSGLLSSNVSVTEFFSQGRYDSIWYYISIVVASLTVMGCGSRLMICLTWLSMFYMHCKLDPIMFGADRLLLMVGFWLIFLDCGSKWSIDSIFRKRKNQIELWPIRCIQIQIALMYLIAGVWKLFVPEWRDGSALFYALQLRQVNRLPIVELRNFPNLISFFTYGSLGIELLFAPFLCFKYLRIFAIYSSIALQIGIFFSMSISFFQWIVGWSMLAFLSRKPFKKRIEFGTLKSMLNK